MAGSPDVRAIPEPDGCRIAGGVAACVEFFVR